MHATLIRFAYALLVLACVSLPRPAAADLMEDHAKLLEQAIVDDDGELVAKLLATPYANPNGFEYRTGRKVIFLNLALSNGKFSAADALLDGNPVREKIQRFSDPGQRWLPSVHLMNWVRLHVSDELTVVQGASLLGRLLKANLQPETDFDYREFELFWIMCFSSTPGSAISTDSASLYTRLLEKYSVRFSNAVQASRWELVFPAGSLDVGRFEEIRRAVGDFTVLDSHGNSVLNALLLSEAASHRPWIKKLIEDGSRRPSISAENTKGFHPADFIWFFDPGFGGRTCMYNPNLANAHAEKRLRLELMLQYYGPSNSWPRSDYKQCGTSARCEWCLGDQ